MLVSAASIHSRLAQLGIAAVCLVVVGWFLLPSSFDFSKHLSTTHLGSPLSTTPKVTVSPKQNHPIDQLILRANEDFRTLVNKETRNLHDAAKAYRARRGRQPPPGFDLWFAFASNHSALIVEDFFDRIYDDLNPFWGIPAKQIREQANDFVHRISVRNGNATGRTDIPREDRPWIGLWEDMVQSVAEYLPDLDMAINVMDESRIVTPWEKINEYMSKEAESRKLVEDGELKTEFGSLKELDEHPPAPFDPGWDTVGAYWPMAVVGCAPDSPARKAEIETDYTNPPPLSSRYPPRSHEGYVSNWTFASSPCDHPNLQGLHGTFVEPISISNTKTLFPLFGGSKLPMNNEILLPPAMYWTDDPFYSGGDSHGDPWEQKKDQLIWRGSASGGRNKAENWARFQRHRFVSMINATSIKQLETQPGYQAPNFVLPDNDTYDLAARVPGAGPTALSDWVATWSDAAVVHLLCFPDTDPPRCPYNDAYFSVASAMPMSEQYAYKYLPDIDGNSFSGRYRGFLGSTSLPIKATIYKEWHDDRLIPWKHFVPMDNTFLDVYGVMEYLVGNKELGLEGHDDVARNIALDGKTWAEKVLRKEDMSVYVLRLLLEYARLCDDDREKMGWSESGVG
ncbi:hypothetical protein PRZ48_006006 [Zasmidium cellare]|uniref:Glycosyl transferase CAP10 domain-containing protein n=1 Tax=Zasmidium cellare TaxID=395010 RepID=A0ABR0EM82_ZASCE|nr:hypothetical protein PRZ48_006006 [Zasmidium cellare]